MKRASTILVLAMTVGMGVLLARMPWASNSSAMSRVPGASPQPPDQQRFLGLGDLPGGFYDSVAYGVSADGTTVAGYSNSAAGMEAFRWTVRDGMVGLGFPRAFAVSADGSTVVGYRHYSGGTEAACWTARGVFGLGNLVVAERGTASLRSHGSAKWDSPPLAEHCCAEALATSADGSVIVGAYSPDGGERNDVPFRWTPAEGTALLDPQNGDSPLCGEARAVSADGAVIVGALRGESDGRVAFRWTAQSGIERLGTLPGDATSVAHAVSADGRVVVGCSEGIDSHAFRWTEETGVISLGMLPGGTCNSHAWAASADGSVIVGQSYGDAGMEAFIWDAAHGMRSVRQVLINDLDMGEILRGWRLLSATAVSADGSIVAGYGFNRSGNREAWISRLGSDDIRLATAR
jgi:probable HAF family extracellular repeat protein